MPGSPALWESSAGLQGRRWTLLPSHLAAKGREERPGGRVGLVAWLCRGSRASRRGVRKGSVSARAADGHGVLGQGLGRTRRTRRPGPAEGAAHLPPKPAGLSELESGVEPDVRLSGGLRGFPAAAALPGTFRPGSPSKLSRFGYTGGQKPPPKWCTHTGEHACAHQTHGTECARTCVSHCTSHTTCHST